MRVTLCMTLAWAEQNGYIQQPNGWLDGIRLPRETHGRKITRTELKPEQTLALVARMKEPVFHTGAVGGVSGAAG
jgi:hypothetical protein